MAETFSSVLSNEALLKQWPHDDELLELTRKKSGDKILLGFSRGKDSIAAWIKLRDSKLFKEIIPIHLYTVPHLRFVDDSIKYFEDVFQTRIYQLPHKSLFRMMAANVFQPPDRLWANADFFERMEMDYVEQNNYFKEDMGLPRQMLQANGVRAMDTPVRRMGIHRHGPFGEDNVKIIWNYSTRDVMQSLERNHIKLPVDYEMFGRSFDGIAIQYTYPIRERFPEDFKKILKWFPFLEMEFFRFEQLEDRANDFVFKNGRFMVNYDKNK